MATVLLSYLRWTAVSPTGSLQIFHSAINTTHFQLLGTVHSSIYWMNCFPFCRTNNLMLGLWLYHDVFVPISICGWIIFIDFLTVSPIRSKILNWDILIHRLNVLKWNVFTISECKWRTILFILFFISCVYEIGNNLTSSIFLRFHKK